MSSYTGRLFKSANFRLSSNVDAWPDEIYRHLSQTHPYLVTHLQGDIDWSEEPIDEELGNGVGTVTALIGDSPLTIPIVVRDFELKPVDMYRSSRGDMDLLSPNMVMENMSPVSVGLGQRIDPHLETAGGLVRKIAGYPQFADDCERITALVEEDFPKLAESCKRLRGNIEQTGDPYDAMAISHTSGTYKLSAFRKGHRIGEFMLNADTVFSDPLSKLAEAGRTSKRDGEVVMTARETSRVAMDAFNPQQIDLNDFTSGLALMTADGINKVGRLAKVSHFTGIDRTVFLTGGAFHEAPEKIASVITPAGGQVEFNLDTMDRVEAAEAISDQSGFLRDGDTLYGPLKVASNFTSTHGERTLSVQTEYGPAEVILSKRATRCVPAGKGRFLLPASAEFMPMEEIEPSPYSPKDVLREKVASDGDASFDIISSSGLFQVQVDDLVHSSLSRGETVACLASLGLSKTSSLGCIKEAELHSGRPLTFYGIEHPAAEHRGESPVHPAQRMQVGRFLDRVIDLRPAINKFASELGTPDLQDDLNSVNLMNQYNAGRYADSIDEVEAAKAAVANILHGIRTDEVESIDEQTAKEALMALDQIIRGLNDISASQQ